MYPFLKSCFYNWLIIAQSEQLIMEHHNIILSPGFAVAEYQSQTKECCFVTSVADHVSWDGIPA